jgi:hypothetical protein
MAGKCTAAAATLHTSMPMSTGCTMRIWTAWGWLSTTWWIMQTCISAGTTRARSPPCYRVAGFAGMFRLHGSGARHMNHQHSTAQHSQHSQHSTAQHSQHSQHSAHPPGAAADIQHFSPRAQLLRQQLQCVGVHVGGADGGAAANALGGIQVGKLQALGQAGRGRAGQAGSGRAGSQAGHQSGRWLGQAGG